MPPSQSQDERLSKIEQGRIAVVASGVVTPFVDEQIAAITDRLVAAYRGGTLTHDQAIGSVGEISALLALLSALESDRRQGDTAAGVEYGS